MAETFDPYHRWLGIPPQEQPPHYYRLLGLNLFEADPDVVENAADQRMVHLRTFQAGKNGPLSQKLLNEISAAKVCLLDPAKKGAYDATLRQQLAPAAAPPPPAVPQAPAQPAMDIRVRSRLVRKKSSPLLAVAIVAAIAVVIGSLIGAIIVSRSNSPQITADKNHTATPQLPAEPAKAPPAVEPKKSPTANEPDATKSDELPAKNASSKKPVKGKPKAKSAKGTTPETPEDDDYTPPPRKQFPLLTPLAGNTVDLLPLIDSRQAKVRGEWVVSSSELVVRAGKQALMQIPYTPPEEYDLRLAIQRGNEVTPGGGVILVGLVVAGKQVQVGFDFTSSGRFVSGISLIEGQQPWRNETRHAGLMLPPGEKVNFTFRVRQNRVQVEREGEVIIDWEADFSRYQVAAESQPPNPGQLAIFSKTPNVHFSQLTVQSAQPGAPPAPQPNRLANANSAAVKERAAEPNASEQTPIRQKLAATHGQPGKKWLPERTQAAVELFDQAKQAQAGSVEQYVLLREAQRWAIEALNSRLAVDVTEMLRSEFDINPAVELPKLIASLSIEAKEDNKSLDSILEAALPVAQRISNEKQFDAAQKTLDALGRIALRSTGRKYVPKVAELKAKLADAMKAARAAKASSETASKTD